MKEQIQAAIADMASKVSFDPEKHVYVENETGLWLKGVSSVSNVVPKDWLAAWGAKEAVKALGYSDYPDKKLAAEVLAKIKQCSVDQYHALLKEAKGASSRKNKQALIDGKVGHAWLEDYVKSKINNTPTPPIPQGNLRRPIVQFLSWEKNYVEYWIASEARVVYPAKGYAGTLDAIAMMKDGKLALIDFKFAQHISEDYYIQTAGYVAPFEQYGIKFDKRIIVRLPKTLEKEEWNPNTHSYKMVENNIQVHQVKTDYEADKNCFFAKLVVDSWVNAVVKG